MTNDEGMTKGSNDDSGLPASGFLRHSSFVIRHSAVGGLGEDRLVAELLASLGPANAVEAEDDCAVLPIAGDPRRWRLMKTDCVIEGVHYPADTVPERVGWKALCRVVSDFAAMGGGQPEHALVTVALRGDTPLAYARGLYAGLGQAAAAFGVVVVGGETARAPDAGFLSVAVSGTILRAACVRRNGGQAGDALFVTGRLGNSFPSGRHLDFTPRLEEARWLTANFALHAMMDLSDGVGADLPRMAKAGGGLGWRLDEERLPLAANADVRAALGDGEDYELLFALAPEHAAGLESSWRGRFPDVPLTRIGSLTAPAAGNEPGLAGSTISAKGAAAMFRCRTPEDTLAAGRALAEELRAGDVLGLVGGLGAGKTHFAKGLAAGLGLDPDAVTSPTFTLLHEYRAPGARLPLFHADFYRLETAAEAGTLGLEELLDEGGGITVIEWADRFPEFLPPGARWLTFTPDADGSRVITETAAP